MADSRAAHRLTIRADARVERQRHPDLESALAALEARVHQLERSTRAKPVSTMLGRSFAPAQQVTARLELSGPHVRGGVDVRGDGSSQAFTGRVRRKLVAEASGESACDALRRALARG